MFFGKLSSQGTVERGTLADVVLLDADPLHHRSLHARQRQRFFHPFDGQLDRITHVPTCAVDFMAVDRACGERELANPAVGERAAAILRPATMSLGRTDTALGAFYRRLAARVGKAKALEGGVS